MPWREFPNHFGGALSKPLVMPGVEHAISNSGLIDLVLALADRVFALERGAVFHQGPAAPLLTDLEYRKKILWL